MPNCHTDGSNGQADGSRAHTDVSNMLNSADTAGVGCTDSVGTYSDGGGIHKTAGTEDGWFQVPHRYVKQVHGRPKHRRRDENNQKLQKVRIPHQKMKEVAYILSS